MAGDWVSGSGTAGCDDRTMTIADDVVQRAEQCLANIAAVVAEAGASLSEVVRMFYILPDAADFEPCWPVLRGRFGGARPAATMVSAGLVDPRIGSRSRSRR